jgi:hypothetical protein
MRDLDDGMAELGIVHSATVIHGIHDRLTRMGKAVESDQRRQARETKEAREAELARQASEHRGPFGLPGPGAGLRPRWRPAGDDQGRGGIESAGAAAAGDTRSAGTETGGDAGLARGSMDVDTCPDCDIIGGKPADESAVDECAHDGSIPVDRHTIETRFADRDSVSANIDADESTDPESTISGDSPGATTAGNSVTDETTADIPERPTALRRDAFGQILDENGYARHPENPGTAPHAAMAGNGENTAAGDASHGKTAWETTGGGADTGDGTEGRTLDELRADIAADLLLSGAPTAHAVCDESGGNLLGAIRGTVQITVPVAVITGTGNTGTGIRGTGIADGTGTDGTGTTADAAFLAGHGPIDSDTARRLAGGATGWDRLFRHPDTGVLLTVDRYTPTELQKRFLTARDETCRFPCCRTPASRADADHTIDWQYGGETNVANMGFLCRAHHMVKHHTPWTVTQLPGGVLEWTSPLGTTYTDLPQPTVRFTAVSDTGPPDRPPF